MTLEKIIILDFGSQYTQLIARRVRELNVYCEILPYNADFSLDASVKAVILSGSPFSVTDPYALKIDLSALLNRIPVLGICYGAQLIASELGGKVERSLKREYGKASLSKILKPDPILSGVPEDSQVWMSHGDTIFEIPTVFELIAGTENIDVALFKSKPESFEFPVYCLQFHPEVTHSLDGGTLLKNFVVDIAGCSQNWDSSSFIDLTVQELREKVGSDQVIMGLSGGVDSSVAATLLHKAIGDQLICVFVDNGLLRKDEYEAVLHSYQGLGLHVIGVDARELFYTGLAGVTDPEAKRKVIGKTFIDVFEDVSEQFPDVQWLGQGTIYPDVIESVSVHGPSVTIKSHHNVGGLPDRLKLKIVEPLRMLFKDEVRQVGRTLGLDEVLVGRHPFPGPGLAIRILGDITPDKVHLLQEADHIFIKLLKEWGLYDKVWQAGVILLPVQSVGVMGDERTYERAVALRAVESVDGMTAEWCKLPYEFLAKVSSDIINQVKGINRVVYDISTKPPSTIEWE
jgi:GMP synthase (glutamine-hydrolysing)